MNDYNPDHDSIVLKLDQLDRLMSVCEEKDKTYLDVWRANRDARVVLAELRKLVVK